MFSFFNRIKVSQVLCLLNTLNSHKSSRPSPYCQYPPVCTTHNLTRSSHHASSPPSQKALNLLRSSLTSPYPPGSSSAAPLEFTLDVVESPPNTDQMQTILDYYAKGNSSPASLFLSAHPSAGGAANSASEIVKLATKNPNTFKWPVVVDWDGGNVSVGDSSGVEKILENLRKKRDGA